MLHARGRLICKRQATRLVYNRAIRMHTRSCGVKGLLQQLEFDFLRIRLLREQIF